MRCSRSASEASWLLESGRLSRPVRWKLRVGSKVCLDLGDVQPAEGMVVRFSGVAIVKTVSARSNTVQEASLEPLELVVSEGEPVA